MAETKLRIPQRSLWRILRVVFDFQERHDDLEREARFSSEVADGVNCSWAVVSTTDPEEETVEDVVIAYRDGLFWCATVVTAEDSYRIHTLSGALEHLDR